MALADALGGVAGGVDFMDGMGHVVGEGGVVEEPGVIGLSGGELGEGEGRGEQSEGAAVHYLLPVKGMWMGQETATMEPA